MSAVHEHRHQHAASANGAAEWKNFGRPDEVREFPKGRFEVVTVHGMTIGRATYQPGWKWSRDVAPSASTKLCEVEHFGIVISGRAVAAYADGSQTELNTGSVFYIPPVPHAGS